MSNILSLIISISICNIISIPSSFVNSSLCIINKNLEIIDSILISCSFRCVIHIIPSFVGINISLPSIVISNISGFQTQLIIISLISNPIGMLISNPIGMLIRNTSKFPIRSILIQSPITIN